MGVFNHFTGEKSLFLGWHGREIAMNYESIRAAPLALSPPIKEDPPHHIGY